MKITVNASKQTGKLNNFWNHIHFHPTDAIEDGWGQMVLNNVRKDNVAKYLRMHSMFEDIVSRDADGKLVYDFTDCDKRCDYLVESGFKALVCFDFMPVCLASDPVGSFSNIRYKNKKFNYSSPVDYKEWQEISAAYTKHLIERYGEEEISTWYFHCWNEPDSGYWISRMGNDEWDEIGATDKIDEYIKLYDHFAAGVTSVCDKIKIGGPSCAGSDRFIRLFMEHVTKGTNTVTGETGTRCDFISVHCYSQGIYSNLPNKTYVSPDNIMQRLNTLHELMKKCGIGSKEVVLDEWGIAGGGFLGIDRDPRMIFRETEYYPAFFARLIDLIRNKTEMNLTLMMICLSGQDHSVTDFDGFRTFFTANSFKKPVYNGYALCSKLGNNLLETDFEKDEYNGIIPTADDSGNVKILLYRHCDVYDGVIGNCNSRLCVEGLKGKYKVKHYRIDKTTSNAYTKWSDLNKPTQLTMVQREIIEKAGELSLYYPEETVELDGSFVQDIIMTQNSVSLIELEKID